MNKPNKGKLLDDKRVVDEIQRHLWIESEKAGYDIGFDRAKEDWLKNFSKAWMDYNFGEEVPRKPSASRTSSKDGSFKKTAKTADFKKSKGKSSPSSKKRRAKTYVG